MNLEQIEAEALFFHDYRNHVSEKHLENRHYVRDVVKNFVRSDALVNNPKTPIYHWESDLYKTEIKARFDELGFSHEQSILKFVTELLEKINTLETDLGRSLSLTRKYMDLYEELRKELSN